MAYSYKGSISFGLVYIPINLQKCVKNNDIGFNMIDKNTMSRIQYKKTCVDCQNKEVKNEDIVKGYEYEKDRYVIFTDEEIEKIKTKKEKSISIERFVDIEEIDPIFYDKAYYVLPLGAEKAFALLTKAMEELGKVGIAKTVLGAKESLIAIRVREGKMLLNTLFFDAEVQKLNIEVGVQKIEASELTLAKDIIKAMSKPFEPQNYKDEYKEKVRSAIDAKIAGKEIVIPKEEEQPQVGDLMEALKQTLNSIDGVKKKVAAV